MVFSLPSLDVTKKLIYLVFYYQFPNVIPRLVIYCVRDNTLGLVDVKSILPLSYPFSPICFKI